VLNIWISVFGVDHKLPCRKCGFRALLTRQQKSRPEAASGQNAIDKTSERAAVPIRTDFPHK
jgi:hypothetical protein